MQVKMSRGDGLIFRKHELIDGRFFLILKIAAAGQLLSHRFAPHSKDRLRRFSRKRFDSE